MKVDASKNHASRASMSAPGAPRRKKRADMRGSSRQMTRVDGSVGASLERRMPMYASIRSSCTHLDADVAIGAPIKPRPSAWMRTQFNVALAMLAMSATTTEGVTSDWAWRYFVSTAKRRCAGTPGMRWKQKRPARDARVASTPAASSTGDANASRMA